MDEEQIPEERWDKVSMLKSVNPEYSRPQRITSLEKQKMSAQQAVILWRNQRDALESKDPPPVPEDDAMSVCAPR